MENKKSFNRFKAEIQKIQKHQDQYLNQDVKDRHSEQLNYNEINPSRTFRNKNPSTKIMPKSTQNLNSSIIDKNSKAITLPNLTEKSDNDLETMNNIITNYLA